MEHIAYFKLQAKNLFRDYKTKKPYIDDVTGATFYDYDPKYFDIDGILIAYDYDEKKFSLMKAQHIIAHMAGFDKWADLLKASESELELAKALFDNEDKISIEDWYFYIAMAEDDNFTTYDSEMKLEILKVFLNQGSFNSSSYRLNTEKS